MKFNITYVSIHVQSVLFLIVVDASSIMAFHLYKSVVDTRSALLLSSRTKIYKHATTSTMVILYHKPIDIVTTHASDDVLGRLNVYQDLIQRSHSTVPMSLPQNFPTGWHSIGRLDAATSGLLLVTNDGGLVHHVTNHRAASATNGPLGKTYEVLAMGYHAEDSILVDQFRQGGIDLGNNQLTLPVQELRILDHPTAKTTRLSMSIIEGRNRQIRRMFHSCGSGVMQLSRIAIGSSSSNCLTIDLVPTAGDWCILPDQLISSTLGWRLRPIEDSKPSVKKSPKRGSPSKLTTNIQTPKQRLKSRR